MSKILAAEVIAIGNELLAGYTINSNAAFIGQKLLEAGIAVRHGTTIGDQPEEIITALETASQRADLIFVTGGLGPTPDDLTKQTICRFFDSRLIEDPAILGHVEELLRHRGLGMLPANQAQALVPDKAQVFLNQVGTAPGLRFEKESIHFFFMPGVPGEMRHLLTEHYLPWLRANFTLPEIRTHLLRTTGIAESRLHDRLKDLVDDEKLVSIAFLPRYIGVDLRFRLENPDQPGRQYFNQFIQAIRERIGQYIFSEAEIELEEHLGQLLKLKGLTLALAESFSGGLIADVLTNIPGSSDYFLGSVTAYSNLSKIDILGVNPETLEKFGAVSAETALEMARGVQKKFSSGCALSTTGIAGPGGATDTKPVGLAYIAARIGNTETVREFHFGSDRLINKKRGMAAALELLRRLLSETR